MITSGLLQSKWSPKDFMLTLQEIRSIHDSMNIQNIIFITYIYILYKYLKYTNYLIFRKQKSFVFNMLLY